MDKALNAVSHGAYSTGKLTLPWENDDYFPKLHEALKQEWCPDGQTEEELVFELATTFLNKKRVTVELRKVFWLQRIGRALDPDVEQSLIAKMVDRGLREDELPDAVQLQLQALDSAIETARREKSVGIISKLKQKRKEAEAYLPEVEEHRTFEARANAVERILSLDGTLDARAERILKRLIAIKEYKKILNLNPTE